MVASTQEKEKPLARLISLIKNCEVEFVVRFDKRQLPVNEFINLPSEYMKVRTGANGKLELAGGVHPMVGLYLSGHELIKEAVNFGHITYYTVNIPDRVERCKNAIDVSTLLTYRSISMEHLNRLAAKYGIGIEYHNTIKAFKVWNLELGEYIEPYLRKPLKISELNGYQWDRLLKEASYKRLVCSGNPAGGSAHYDDHSYRKDNGNE